MSIQLINNVEDNWSGIKLGIYGKNISIKNLLSEGYSKTENK